MTKISALTPLGDDLAVGDQFIIRDISDAGTPNKSVTISGITRGLEVGTALAPSIAFAADKNTGIYGTGSDVLALVTAGENRLHITSGGLVGIGTSSPTAKLTVGDGSVYLTNSSTSASTVRELFNYINPTASVASSNGLSVGIRKNDDFPNRGASVRFIQTGTSDSSGDATTAISFFTYNNGSDNGAERMRLTGTGLGIGTTTPGQLLQVGSGSGAIRVGTASGLDITHDNSGFTVAEIKQLYATTSDAAQLKIISGFTSFHTGTSNAERARIDSSGRLLVGTSSSDGAPSSGAIIQLANQFSVRAVDGGGVTNQRAFTASATTLNCVIDVPISSNGTSSFIGSLYISQQLTNSDKSFLAEYRVKIYNAGGTAVFTLVDSVDDSSPNNVALTFTYSSGNRQITVTSTWTTATSSALGCNLIGAGAIV